MDEKRMKRGVFHVFHRLMCGKLFVKYGKRVGKCRFCVEKRGKNCGKHKENPNRIGCWRANAYLARFLDIWTDLGTRFLSHGKSMEKIFYDVDKYVESVTNRAKSSFSALFARMVTVFVSHI